MAESLSAVSEVKTPGRTAVKNNIMEYRHIVCVEHVKKATFICLYA